MYTQKILVFLGPSLAKSEAQKILPNAVYLPPVQCGDIISACSLNPAVILIIDGYFDNKAAVWHKEILHAMALGIVVHGAASMGALRAAELSDFGMRGHGQIVADFKSELLEDDDEVAVVHKTVEWGYESITDAMVNVRATVKKALGDSIISQVTAQRLIELAKETFYKQRVFSIVLSDYKREYSKNDIAEFEKFLISGGYVDQKKEDACEALLFLAENDIKPTKAIKIENTLLLQRLIDRENCEFLPGDKRKETKKRKAEKDVLYQKITTLLAYALRSLQHFSRAHSKFIDADFLQLELQSPKLLFEKIQRDFHDKEDLRLIFRHLKILFGLSKEEIEKQALAQQLTKTEKAFFLLSCSLSMMNNCLDAEELLLESNLMQQYLQEICQKFLLSTQNELDSWLLHNKIDLEWLIRVYAISQELLNKSGSYFFAGSEGYASSGEHYLKKVIGFLEADACDASS